MRYSSADERLVIEFTLSENHPPEFGFARLIIDGIEVGDFQDLTGLWGFLATLQEPSNFTLEELDPECTRIDLILHQLFSDENVESATLIQLGEAFDASFIRRYALPDQSQVFLYSSARDNSVHAAKFAIGDYQRVTDQALNGYKQLLPSST